MNAQMDIFLEEYSVDTGQLLFVEPYWDIRLAGMNEEELRLFYQIRLLNANNFPEIEKLRGFLTELRRLSLSGISFSELRGCVLLYLVFYSARRKSLRADRNCHTAKNRPFRTGTPPDNCCMYLDLESLHRTGFPGRSIKSRRILPLPFFQAVPRIHRPLLHGFRHQGTAPYRRKPVKKTGSHDHRSVARIRF